MNNYWLCVGLYSWPLAIDGSFLTVIILKYLSAPVRCKQFRILEWPVFSSYIIFAVIKYLYIKRIDLIA
jgi:hypothetical protein